MREKLYNLFHRVDVQVSLFTGIIAVLSGLCIFLMGYYLTYEDTIYSLNHQVDSINQYLSEHLTDDSFTNINNRADTYSKTYIHTKTLIQQVKESNGLEYLYTAKKTSDGKYIYVIDGLSESDSNFRYPGDLIEEEIIPDMEKALSGEKVTPEEIIQSSWGNIFLSYVPVYGKNGEVIGVIGLEFNANHQYATYYILRITIPFILFFTCILAIFFAKLNFRRISNPKHLDMANTDILTNVKNKNAYETDVNNLATLKNLKNLGIVMIDINHLKPTNDNLGHLVGDKYIKSVASSINAEAEREIVYRVGGDEFIILVNNATNEYMEELISRIKLNFKYSPINEIVPNAAFSYGYSICLSNNMEAYNQAYHEADQNMYINKKAYYDNLKKTM